MAAVMISSLLTVRPVPSSGDHHGHTTSTGLFIFGIVLLLIGALNAAKPDLTFRMNRWQYKNKDAFEPSGAALVVTRVGGIVALIAGVVVIIVAATR